MKTKKIASAIIIDDNKVLLIKRKFDPYKNTWAPPGGGIDKLVDSSLEEACIRETKEETGLDVNVIKKIRCKMGRGKNKPDM